MGLLPLFKLAMRDPPKHTLPRRPPPPPPPDVKPVVEEEAPLLFPQRPRKRRQRKPQYIEVELDDGRRLRIYLAPPDNE